MAKYIPPDGLEIVDLGGYSPYPRQVATFLGTDEAIMLGYLVNQHLHYSRALKKKENATNKNYYTFRNEGFFYAIQDDIFEATALKEKRVRAAVSVLIDHNLIEADLRGVPPKRHFRIHADFVAKFNLVLEKSNAERELRASKNFNFAIPAESISPVKSTPQFGQNGEIKTVVSAESIQPDWPNYIKENKLETEIQTEIQVDFKPSAVVPTSASGGEGNSSGFADLVEIENQTSKPKPPEANMERSSAAAAPAEVEFTELSEIKSAVETALWVGHGGTTRNAAPFLRMIATHDHIDGEKIIGQFASWWSRSSGHPVLEAPEGFKSEKDGEWGINPKTKRSQPPTEEAKEYLKWVRHVCNSFKKNFVLQVNRAEEKEEKIQKKAREIAFKKSSQDTLLDAIGDAYIVQFKGNEVAKSSLLKKSTTHQTDEAIAAFIKNVLYSFSATMISEKKDSDFWASVDRFGMDFKDGGNPAATDGQIVSTIKKCFFVQSTKKKISPAGWASSVSVEEKTGFDFSPYSKIFASLSAVLGVTIK